MQVQTASLIKKLHDTTNECLHAIQKMGVDTSTWDPIIVHLLAQKLDVDSHNDYVESLNNPRELPTIKEFLSFLETKFTALEAFRRKQESTKPTNQEDHRFKKPYYLNSSIPSSHRVNKSFTKPSPSYKTMHVETKRCPHCNENHAIYLCKTFRDSRPDVKQKTIAKHNLCKNCLFDHACLSTKTCRHCNAKHNSLIHDLFASLTENSRTNIQANDRKSCHVSQENIAETLLATARVNVLAADGRHHTMRVLIDQGSQTSLITENAAQRLRLTRQRCKGVIFGVGAKENNCKGVIRIQISSLQNNFSTNTDVFIMKNLINKLPNQSFEKPTWKYLDTINLADPEFYISKPIDILLGADVYSSIIMSGIIKVGPSYPIAQETQLGWILCGNIKTFYCNVVINQTDELQKFWEMEDITQTPLELSEAENHCIQFYQSTTLRDESGRYHVKIPFKPNYEKQLGVSKPMAVAQFYQLERKLSKNKSIAKDYKMFIDEYRSLGHMIPVNDGNTKLHCYLPHHGVQRSESTTTALRVVFNASAKTSTGLSLNDVMEVGPNLQLDLQTLILKWRKYEYAFVADIEKMFRQIGVQESDQKYQKIIWRDTLEEPLQEYQLTTVTYGTKAAPFLAMMTLKQLAIDEQSNYQQTNATKVLAESFYMDDLLHGSHSIYDGKLLKEDLIKLLKSGGFNLRKWKSNAIELLSDQTQTNQECFDFKQAESTKTLGLRWQPQTDLFLFDFKFDFKEIHPTKRILLSDISKIFDPLGWLSPLTTKLKILFQKVWQLQLRWDEKLPEDICSEWNKVKDDLHNVGHIQLTRWLGMKKQDIIEFHGFCDASTKAYAAVIYCKISCGKAASVVLVVGKTRLVPASKTITLPKLELCGALLLANLMQKVQTCFKEYKTKTYGWIDSMVVLGWLNGEPSRWKPFVANRVRQITEHITPENWQYVKSEENPADCASRGLNASQTKQHPLWWQGPHWLPYYSDNYKQDQKYTTDLEIKKIKPNNMTNLVTRVPGDNIIVDLISKQSSITRAVRIFAWIMRLRKPHKLPYLTCSELNDSKLFIIKTIQNQEFSNEITKLKNNQHLDNRSKILCLNPFLDENGLLRVGGRLKNTFIHENMKHPIIIPSNHRLTELLINHAHHQTLHGGARLTQAYLRQNYWIVSGNRATKKQIRLCIRCRRNNPSKHQQLMADLPAARSNPSKPFLHTGVDFTGSVLIKANKGRGVKTTKGYVAVFVCMVTKAVHLELVSDLSTSSFLAALRRMAARRGTPHHIYSDNGTNFVGAGRVLNREFEELRQNVLNEEFMSEIAEMGIKWSYNAPAWPTAGGLWEGAVKSLKFHLKRVVGEQKLTFEEFTTILTQVEACLNSRPLCPLTEDPEDLDYLTPSHFLSSGPNLTIFETERDERTRWQLTQKIFQDIWKRWQAEYLTLLSARSKWREPKENININDVVIIHDNQLPPGKWALGRVLELHPGKDGYVRVVTLKTKNGILKRPTIKLSVLPVSQNHENTTTTSETKPVTIQKKKPLGSYFTTILMLITLLFTPAQGTYNINPLNNSMYYFDKESTMYLIRDEWKLIAYLDLEPYWKGAMLFDKYLSHLTNICNRTKIKAQCDIVLLQLGHGYDEYKHYNGMLLGQQVSAHDARRKRRGLINGIGSVAHTLFGVLDESFAEQYSKDINLIHTNEKHLESLWRNQTSIVEAEYNFLKKATTSVDKQYKIFNQHLNSFEKTANELKIEIKDVATCNDFAITAIIANNMLSGLRKVQDTLLDAITNIYYGNFNVHLLKPEQLLQELHLIAGRIPKDLSLPLDNIFTQLPKLYHVLKVKARITKQFLLFEIKIPLVSRDLFDIYKIIPIPRAIDNTMVTLLPVASHVAINLQKDLFVPLSENTLHTCISYDIDVHLCPLQSPIYQFKSDQTLCVKDTTRKTCKTKTIPCEHSWSQLHKINTYLFTCCGECTIRIICDQLIAAERLEKAGIITLGNNCVIKDDSLTITSHKQFFNNINIQPDIVTPDIPPINNIINVAIPNTTIEIESSGLEKDLKIIGDQIKDIKSKEGIADVVSYHDVHHYVAIYGMIAAAVFIGLGWLWRRQRARRGARARSDVDAVYSASVQCVSVKDSGASEQPKCISVNKAEVPSVSARVDTANMPNFRNHFQAANQPLE